MDEQFKEIEGLLENVEQVQQRSFKKYAKLIIPHVALVTAVCLYAMCGAFLFYTLESPHEDMLKKNGVKRINDKRQVLTRMMFEARKRDSVRVWMEKTEGELLKFNEELYRAFKDEYVRYSDVRVKAIPGHSEPRSKRHRKSKSRTEKSEKMWTGSSALFFAATTMATIGYGNIVPVTPYGRITCVIFALFGAPLAIITIGDLGKFLSECTIWLYKKLRKMRKFVHIRYKRWKLRKSGVVIEADEESSSQSSKSRLEWDDLSMDKTEVPVLLVFAILLLYIAFGGVLFAFLESWTYMDAFYYCFVSLTTIGFGDIVPERHEYIVIMLVYLGVGLAVTTMCIDLVGIQYIQKIHYFGRKFRGTDLLHLLKRKRMLERRLAMGQGEEILQMYLQQMTQENRQEFRPPPILIADQCYVENEEEKYSMRSDRKLPSFRLDAVSCNDSYMLDFPVADRLRSPTVYSMRSIKSFYTNSSASARSLMYKRGLQTSRGDSWVESGPDLSFHCSLSPSPSIHQRQQMYDNYKSPEPSVLSFEYQFRLPSPDLKEIAEKARAARRNMSCPNSFRPIISPRVPPLSPITPTPMGMACMEEWDSYIKMLDEYCKPFVSPRPPEVVVEEASMEESMPFEQIPEEPEGLEEIVSPMAPESTSSSSAATPSPLFDIDLGAFELVDSGVSAEALLSHDDPVIFHKDMPVHSVHHDTVQTEAALENLMNAPSSMLSSVVPPTMVADNYCFVVDGDKVRMGDIMGDDQWWRHTSRPTRYFYSDDLKKFHRVNCIMAKGKVISARLAGGASTSSIFNNPSSSSSSSSHNTPRSSLSTARSGRGEKVNLKHVYKVIRFYSFWKTCTSFHRIVTMIDKVSNDDKNANPQFRRRLFVQYLWRNAKAVEKARVQKEFDPRRQRLLRFVTDPASRKRIAGKK